MRDQRKDVRLRQYDYRSNGAYAITICVQGRCCAFGRIENGAVRLHPFGRIAEADWLAMPSHYRQIELDEWIVMPNHLHGILWIRDETPPLPAEEAQLRQFGKPLSGSLSCIIGSYKSGVTRQISAARQCRTKVWQRGFYEHVIRNDRDLQLQREYIRNNPAKWIDDELNSHPS